MFQSYTYGKVQIEKIPDYLLKHYQENLKYNSLSHIVIGTDSQNFSDYTKIVTVICILCEGHGGIFFYDIKKEKRIFDVRKKLEIETQCSLETAGKIVEILEGNEKYDELYMSCPISIHIDAGNSKKGKTWSLIPELVGWVSACGYDCNTKPQSFVASSIADKISK